MNDERLAVIDREVLSWPGVSKETHRAGWGLGRTLGFTGDSLQAWPQGARTHPRHQRGGPRDPEGDPRRTDFQRTDEAPRGRIRELEDVPGTVDSSA